MSRHIILRSYMKNSECVLRKKNNGIEYAKYTHLNLRVTFLYVPSQTKRSKRMKIIHPLKKFFFCTILFYILYFQASNRRTVVQFFLRIHKMKVLSSMVGFQVVFKMAADFSSFQANLMVVIEEIFKMYFFGKILSFFGYEIFRYRLEIYSPSSNFGLLFK